LRREASTGRWIKRLIVEVEMGPTDLLHEGLSGLFIQGYAYAYKRLAEKVLCRACLLIRFADCCK